MTDETRTPPENNLASEARTPHRKEPASHRSRLIASLRTRTALRQAIVLAEILAPPVTLRPGRSPGQRATR
jgi:hypothetical protein